MERQLTADEKALPLFFTDDVYLVAEAEPIAAQQISTENSPVNASAIAVEQPIAPQPTIVLEEVVLQPVAPSQPVAPPTVYKFLGNNKRNILILVNDAAHDVSDEKGRELLRKIVKSVNLTAADFALLNYAGYHNTSFAQLKQYFSCAFVFAFGVSPQHLGMDNHPQNKVVTIGSVKLIFSAELRKLEEDMEAKKTLWGSLKQMGL
ncbi:MAG: hypothetical protein V4594_23315 [Bacteroidota bacterium]